MITMATLQGTRSHQEDRCFAMRLSHGEFMAVMDGHGGSEAVSLCKDHLGSMNTVWRLSRSQAGLKTLVAELAYALRNQSSGCTFSAVLIDYKTNKAHVAIIGDSPVIVLKKHSSWVSPEHNVRSNIMEREAAIKRGAIYVRGYIGDPNDAESGGLQLSRALGDRHLDRILLRVPNVKTITLTKDTVILAMTDGMLNSSHDNISRTMMENMAKAARCGTAKSVLIERLNWGIEDNATIALWKRSLIDQIPDPLFETIDEDFN